MSPPAAPIECIARLDAGFPSSVSLISSDAAMNLVRRWADRCTDCQGVTSSPSRRRASLRASSRPRPRGANRCRREAPPAGAGQAELLEASPDFAARCHGGPAALHPTTPPGRSTNPGRRGQASWRALAEDPPATRTRWPPATNRLASWTRTSAHGHERGLKIREARGSSRSRHSWQPRRRCLTSQGVR